MRVLLFTYEFTFSPFSGNGLLSRSLAKALLSLGCSLRVICCRPGDIAGLAEDNHLSAGEVPPASIELWPVNLPGAAGWRRLDDSSAWQLYWEGSAAHAARAAEWQPDVAIAVDWTGAGAWRAIKSVWATDAPPLCYLNFRVFSSGVLLPEVAAWFDQKESQALAEVRTQNFRHAAMRDLVSALLPAMTRVRLIG